MAAAAAAATAAAATAQKQSHTVLPDGKARLLPLRAPACVGRGRQIFNNSIC